MDETPRASFDEVCGAAAALLETQWFPLPGTRASQAPALRRTLQRRGVGHVEVYVGAEGPYLGMLIVAHKVRAGAGYTDRAPERRGRGRPRKKAGMVGGVGRVGA